MPEQLKYRLTFDSSGVRYVLGLFGKTVDDEKYLVEQDDPNQRVLTVKGEEIRLPNFAGIRKGSEIYVKSDIDSLIEAADHIE
jgi:hypothetical protein